MNALLRQRNFVLLWFGQLISVLGDWILWITLPFYIYEQTGSPLATGAMFIVQTLPPILFGSLAGVFVDRWDRRWTMVIADLLRALLLLMMLVSILYQWLWILYSAAFIDTVVSLFFTPAKNAMIPRIVGKEHLLAANQLNSLSDNLAMIIGPALGGTLITFIGINNVILLDGGSFLFSALMIYLVRLSPEAKQEQINAIPSTGATIFASVWHEWQQGFQLVNKNRLLLALFIIMSVAMIGQGIISVQWVIYVREILRGGPFEYGIVQVAVATGGILGAFILGQVGRVLRPAHLVAISGMGTGLLLFATFSLPHLPTILALQCVAGIVSVGFFVTTQTLLQNNTADHYLGRVLGAYGAANALAVLSGQGFASVTGGWLSTVLLLDAAAGFYLLSGVVALFMLPRLSGVLAPESLTPI